LQFTHRICKVAGRSIELRQIKMAWAEIRIAFQSLVELG
jgi:hypothetical protein